MAANAVVIPMSLLLKPSRKLFLKTSETDNIVILPISVE